MKNNFFYNRFLPILSVFLLVLFIFNISKASNDNEYYSFNDETYGTIKFKLPDNCINYCISQYDKGYFCFIYTDNSSYHFAVKNENDTYKKIFLYTDNTYSTTVSFYRLRINDNWAFEPIYDETLGCYILDFSNASSTLLINEPLYFSTFNTSNQDLTNIDDNTLFFQKAPQEMSRLLVEETAKVQIMEQLKIMIVGFLKYLIVLVISLIAFWKGWQFLSTQLRNA